MSARVIDGVAAAAEIYEAITKRVADLKSASLPAPGLATVLVGDDPASHTYVKNKRRRAEEAGMKSFEHTLPANATTAELLDVVRQLNANEAVHGILVQMPLPQQIDPLRIIEAIDPAKDVDGLHPLNAGKLAGVGAHSFVPCTPLGCLHLMKRERVDFAGKTAVVVGRSTLVGKPMAQLLLREHCTVTMAHSRTKDVAAVCRGADILVAAIGKPGMIKGDFVKPGAIVIDVGINRVPAAEAGKSKLVGDVDFAEASQIAGLITPVPGGVGPMTIAMLMRNTLEACSDLVGLDWGKERRFSRYPEPTPYDWRA
ncbi:MAG TPA: bifunctional methylenetetrahydrofolate dehydrogenase/methenyltetrahydrofolate cyclohydrolase FolD [Magnetospirillaceae bacterium]|jgi:methylenetetrahydrofolate dehydrogenase (NADP+)/methenyltetrahydrofolate cyclohydrolase